MPPKMDIPVYPGCRAQGSGESRGVDFFPIELSTSRHIDFSIDQVSIISVTTANIGGIDRISGQ